MLPSAEDTAMTEKDDAITQDQDESLLGKYK